MALTALQAGLVPGLALQDGDAIARIVGGSGGGFGLGPSTSSAPTDLTNTGNNAAGTAAPVGTSATVVGTATATGNSIKLVTIPVTTSLRIYNESVRTIYVFPPTGQSIDGAAANTAVFLASGARCDYMYMGNNLWKSNLLGTTSA